MTRHYEPYPLSSPAEAIELNPVSGVSSDITGALLYLRDADGIMQVVVRFSGGRTIVIAEDLDSE